MLCLFSCERSAHEGDIIAFEEMLRNIRRYIRLQRELCISSTVYTSEGDFSVVCVLEDCTIDLEPRRRHSFRNFPQILVRLKSNGVNIKMGWKYQICFKTPICMGMSNEIGMYNSKDVSGGKRTQEIHWPINISASSDLYSIDPLFPVTTSQILIFVLPLSQGQT